MKKKDWIIVIVIALIAFIVTYSVSSILLNSNKKEPNRQKTVKEDNVFAIKFIKEVNKNNTNKNYLVSPYSVEVATSMLKEGADGDTLKEINKLVRKGDFKVNNDKVKIANALFIKDDYKDVIEKKFTNTLKDKYKSELLVDKFNKPDVINNWVKKKTDGMIPKILDKMEPDFALGIANAISIDVKWQTKFECEYTRKEKFTSNNKDIDVEMMHDTYMGSIKYLNDDVKGILLPYEDNLEFIGIIPNTDLKEFIDDLDNKKLNKYLSSFKEIKDDQEVELSLPRFSYEYDFKEFKDSLKNLGMKNAFDKDNANFNKIITKENLNKLKKDNIYLDDAIHKTKIELNEEGTKAAAITYYGMKDQTTAIEKEPKKIAIKFNKPFMYIIRDTKSKEILFFGLVYEPNKWKGTTCTEESE